VVLLAPVGAVREAAAGEHDTAGGLHVDLARLALHDGAGDLAVVHDQLPERRGQPHRRALAEHDLEEGARQRSTRADELLAAHRATEGAADKAGAAREAARRGPGPCQQPDVVGLERERHAVLGAGRVPPRPDPLGVEGLDLERPADLAARSLGVVVGVVGCPGEPHAQPLRQRDEVRDRVDEGLLARTGRGGTQIADRGLHVLERFPA
jgi:hypothetical protein